MEDFIVTMSDVRKTGHCVLGIRRWAMAHGLNFRDFIDNGIAASAILATGDGVGAAIVGKVRTLKAKADG